MISGKGVISGRNSYKKSVGGREKKRKEKVLQEPG